MKVSRPRQQGSLAAATALALLLVTDCTAEDLSGYNGAQLYQRFCASCHGTHGFGDGPVASSIKGMVPDLTRIAKRHGGVFPAEQLRRIIDGREVQSPHGTREMPVWGYEFRHAGESDLSRSQSADELIGKLVDYLRSIQSQ